MAPGPSGSGGAVSPSSGPQEYLVLGNPFQDPELLESMRRQWQQLSNWKSATVEGLTWEGTAEENVNHVGVAGDKADSNEADISMVSVVTCVVLHDRSQHKTCAPSSFSRLRINSRVRALAVLIAALIPPWTLYFDKTSEDSKAGCETKRIGGGAGRSAYVCRAGAWR